jgi:DNA-binding transcriptional ArsR family regulator
MLLRNPQSAQLPVDLRFGPAFELLVELYAAGTPSGGGELWLHLLGLGLALELEAGSAAAWIERVADVDAAELRRHLVGVHVPAWREVAGVETLERAAAGDEDAARMLLANDRYYAGRARESLGPLLPLSAAETRERVLQALRDRAAEFAAREADVLAQLAADADAKRLYEGYELIDHAAGGYRYETEPGFERVVLVPHIAARPWLLLCQHETTRIICYPARDAEPATDERLVELGRALADSKRIAILTRLRGGDATLAELATELRLAKSTTHHHVGQLRRAGLVALAGNAAGYRYTLAPDGFTAAERLLGSFVGRSL